MVRRDSIDVIDQITYEQHQLVWANQSKLAAGLLVVIIGPIFRSSIGKELLTSSS